jgi:dUTP pyrophosphatase
MTTSPQLKKRKMSPENGVPPLSAMELRVKKLSDKAKLPVKGSALSAGYDLSRFVFVACLLRLTERDV